MAAPVCVFLREKCTRGTKFHFSMTDAEAFAIGIDYRTYLPDGVFLDSVTPVVTDLNTGLDVTGTVVAGSSIENDDDGNATLACIQLQNGVNRHKYRIEALVAFDDSFTLDEPCLEYRVKNC